MKPKLEDIPSEKQLAAPKEAKISYKFESFGTSQVGYQPYTDKTNQDAFSINSWEYGDHTFAFYIVCDGHGKFGERTSQYCVREIPVMVKRYIEKKKNVTQEIITDAIRDSCELAQRLLEKSNNQVILAGTTYVSALIWNNQYIFLSNAGDSRAFLASKKGNHVVVRLETDDQKPENPEEEKRIRKAGGVVMALKDDDGSDFGPARVWNREMTAPGLAMSRSIGDKFAHGLGVIATPETKVIALCAEDKFVCLCSDGVFEFLSNQYCIGKILPYYTKGDLQGACKK